MTNPAHGVYMARRPRPGSQPSVAVCTVVRGRQSHLRNLLRGLSSQTRAPDHTVVAVMGGPDPSEVIAETDMPVRLVDAADPTTLLPLARARNIARAATDRADLHIFLDVDVIPHPHLVADYEMLLRRTPGIWSGRVDYLRRPLEGDPVRADHLDRLGAPHPARLPPVRDGRLPRPELFWSLSFAVDARSWNVLGGFDESFVGYGAEDTDFGLRAERAGVWLGWTARARGWHQHHGGSGPPLQHLEDIVANACRFHARWGRWPMEGWLSAFQARGLVTWDRVGGVLTLAPRPSAQVRRPSLREEPSYRRQTRRTDMNTTTPTVLSATSLEGNSVRNRQGEDLGKVKDLMIDLRDGGVQYAVVSFGGFLGMGDKLFAVPFEAMELNTDDHTFVLDVSKDRLENAPGFDKDNWPSFADREFTDRVNAFYRR